MDRWPLAHSAPVRDEHFEASRSRETGQALDSRSAPRSTVAHTRLQSAINDPNGRDGSPRVNSVLTSTRPPPMEQVAVVQSPSRPVWTEFDTSRRASASASSCGSPGNGIAQSIDKLHGPTTANATAASSTLPSTPTPGTGKVKKKRIRVKTERRREQCRLNQARYRQKQKTSAVGLERTVQQLRCEVEQLQQHEQSLRVDVSMRTRAVDVVVQYFRLFRYGLSVDRESFSSVSPSSSSSSSSSSASTLENHRILPSLNDQVAFVLSTFHRGLAIGDVRGYAVFLEQMRRFTYFFDDLELSYDDHGCVAGDDAQLISASYQLEGTISDSTIRHVFPHLQRAENHVICRKLLGRRLRCSAQCCFVFNASGHIVQIDWTINFVRALQAILRIEETAVVLHHARIERDSFLVATEAEGSP